MTTLKPSRAEEWKITQATRAKKELRSFTSKGGNNDRNDDREKSGRGRERERERGNESVGGEGALMETNRRLEDVYMFVLQVSWSRSLCTLTGPRQNAFIRASWGGPWERTVCQHRERLPTAGPTLLHERRRKRAIPTLAEPPPLGSDLDRHWRLSTVQKRKNYHKHAFFQMNISWSHHGKRGLSLFIHRRLHSAALTGGCASFHVCNLLHTSSTIYHKFILKVRKTAIVC